MREDIDLVLKRRSQILERIKALVPAKVDALRTRFHGDYHLGQVVMIHDDVLILDFEGEPTRPLAQRRAKGSPLKDVAGMLRSFSYAAWASVFEHTAGAPEMMDKLLPLAMEWERRTAEAFWTHYEATLGDCRSVPADPGQLDSLLQLFLFEKLFYEICYELANRPDWLRIPLAGLKRLLEETETE